MRKLLTTTALIASPLLWSLAMAPAANALPITVIGQDNLGNTASNTAPSPVSFGPTTVGSWTLSGLATGSPPAPLGTLLSNTIQFNSDGAGTLTLWVTETGLTGPLGTIPYFSSLTTNQLNGSISSVTLTTSLQTDNSTPGPTVPLGTILDTATFLTSNQVQTLTTPTLTGTGPYSLTEKYVVVTSGNGDANLTIDIRATAPEPASLALLGVGLLGLGFVTYRKRGA